MATTATEAPGDPVSVGRVIERGFSAAAGNPVAVFGTALAFSAVPSVILTYAMGAAALVDEVGDPLGFGLAAIVSTVVNFLLSMFVHGAVVHAAIRHLDGHARATLGECMAASLRVLLPMIGLGLVIFVCGIVGLGFFIVPGVMIYVLWSVATPALVAERAGAFDALGRSRRLTKGARWRVFGLLLIIVVVYYMILGSLGFGTIAASGGMTAVARGGAFGLPVLAQIFNAAVGAAATAVWSTIQTALYVALRDWKDGPSADRLADVFA